MAWAPAIDLGEWLPDQPALKAPALRKAQQVFPRGRGYDVWPIGEFANRGVLDARPRGAFSGRTRQGTNFVVAGTTSKLYLSTTVGLVDETWLTGPYAADKRWDFTLFGDDLVAVDYIDAPQRFVLGTSTEFAQLHADAPRARHCAVVREFLVMGNIVGRGVHAGIYGTREDGVHWSAQGDAGGWPQAGTNAANAVLSDWQALIDDGGAITDLVGGSDYGLVFKERSIWRMDFEGGSTFFGFHPIEQARGAIVPGSAIRVGARTYFISGDGIYMTEGGGASPIGSERVDRWLHDLHDHDRYEYTSTFVHPHLPVIGWAFRSKSFGGEAADRILLYNYAVDRFSYASFVNECMLTATQQAISLDTAPYATTNMDGGTLTNLDEIVGGSETQLAYFNAADHGLYTLTGSGRTQWAVLVTGDFELAPGRTAIVNGVRMRYDAETTPSDPDLNYTAIIERRRRLNQELEMVTFAAPNEAGVARGRASGRYHALHLELGGPYKEVHGVEADFVARGVR